RLGERDCCQDTHFPGGSMNDLLSPPAAGNRAAGQPRFRDGQQAPLHSRDRILTTHVGSLPRTQPVVDVLLRKERGERVDPMDFAGTVAGGVAEIVSRQAALGIDIVSDGEMSKIGYSTYIKDRLSGFDEEEYTPKPNLDLKDHPEFRKKMA